MEFRILGPLEMAGQDGLLQLGSPAERHLLALLVCLANETVPTERLIDELWGEDPPATARNMIQRYVSRLRRSLGESAATRLTTVASGYSLRVGEGELDSAVFESMVTEALQREDPSDASALVRQALDLWRGAPLVGVDDGRTVTVERVRLHEARLSALEERIDCDLELGLHHDLVSELEGVTAQFPLREHFRAQLMTALYRCDREAEALRTYADYRTRLAEETGLAPSQALVDLEERILARNPDLDPSSPRSSSASSTNLPYRVSRFIGRKGEIEALARQVTDHRLVTLVGTGGIGKTSLAMRVARDVAVEFPDGVWLIDLAPLGDPSLIGDAAVSVLDARATANEDSIDAAVRHMREQTVLLVLDNCEHLIDGAARFAHKVLRSTENVHVLATSREALSVAGESIINVPPLDVPDATAEDPTAIGDSEAVELFADRAGLLRPEFRIDDTNAVAVAEICRRLDGIPLAIELAAARLGTMAVEQIADGVEDRYHLLTRGARTAPHRHQTLQALVDWSYELLTGDGQVLLRRLAVFTRTFTADAAVDVCGFEHLKQATVLDALEQLVDASLVIPPDPPSDRFTMLETIRQYARHLLESSGETDQAMGRLGTYLVEAGPETEDGMPGSDYGLWYRWRDDQQDDFRAVLTWSLEAGDADITTALVAEFHAYLTRRQLGAEATHWVEQALVVMGEETSHRHMQMLTMSLTDEMLFGDHGHTQAMTQSLYREARALGDDGAMGIANVVQSVIAFRQGDLEGALRRIVESLEHFRAANGLHAPRAHARHSFFLTRLGRYPEARVAAAQIIEETALLGDHGDDRYALAISNVYGAIVAIHEAKLDEAEQLLDIESPYFHQLGTDDLQAFLWAKWNVVFARGEWTAASGVAAELSDAIPETATPDALRDAAFLRALPALDIAGPQAAIPDFRKAVRYARQDDSVIDSADVIVGVADVALAAGDNDAATRLYAAVSAVYERSGIVLARWRQQRLDRSLEALRSALGPDRFNDLWHEGSTLTPTEMLNLADDYLNRSQTSPA